jgi:hypothetical protein
MILFHLLIMRPISLLTNAINDPVIGSMVDYGCVTPRTLNFFIKKQYNQLHHV